MIGKIIYLMGKSSTGKDTIYRRLLESDFFRLKRMVPYTTRPIRDGEEQGKQYYFTDEEGFHDLESRGKVIEDRAYHTYHGVWRYFTVDDGNIELDRYNYLAIGTLESFVKTSRYFGENRVIPVLIDLDDGIRLQRALDRERRQEEPRYQELCRRFLADSEDFAGDKVFAAGIGKRFYNDDLEECLTGISSYIKNILDGI